MQIKRKLRMRISAEPNRLAEMNLSNAYEKLIPIIKHAVTISEKKAKNDIDMEQLLIMKGNQKW